MRDERVLPVRHLAWILAFYCGVHVSVAVLLNWNNMTAAMVSLDSEWYEHITRHGYVGNPGSPQAAESVYAFFPAWPLIVRAASLFWPASLPLTALGSLLALMFFVTNVILMNQRRADDPVGLTPRTPLGLWCLIFAPGAWVFFSNHTEALFLLLSWGAFATALRPASKGSFVQASALAGLAALTRNQGILTAVFVGLALATRTPHVPIKKRWRLFMLSGLISGAIFAPWPVFQWLATGNPFMSTAAQKHWYVASGFFGYLQNFFWISANNFWRALTFWSCLFVGFRLALANTSSRPLGLYVLASALLWPLQGNNLPQAYRFSSVLFPFWFYLGDAFTARIERWAQAPFAKLFVRFGFLLATIVLSSAYYTRVRWAY